ncbi:hypothetical protein [Alteromonas sp. KUL49]|uniref:hypothetical protein n=1 Tax=Alteromonas sp. KUL49 TaxID=2480798 RepID=UPI00102F0F43|nr:hypothetical protein [Alteromonas sp. KUL49]TAP40698.1 hypothetical protein EYS00_06160 [Alteromonas sp. KUL49]GEA10866.1 hypothetical protein KUL49_12410 [Alteromonas sp. KUL49]
MWVNDKKVVHESSAIEEFSQLSDLSVQFDWKDATLKVALNNQYKVELPFPPKVGSFSFGIQSAKCQIKVWLPNQKAETRTSLSVTQAPVPLN